MLNLFRNPSTINVAVSNMYIWTRITEASGDELLHRHWYDLWVGTELHVCKKKKSDLVRKRRELSASMRSLVFCYWVPATLLASFGLRCLHTVFLSPSALGLTLLNKELWMIFERDVRGGWDTYRETQIALHYSYFTWTWFFSTYLCFLSKYSTKICVSY